MAVVTAVSTYDENKRTMLKTLTSLRYAQCVMLVGKNLLYFVVGNLPTQIREIRSPIGWLPSGRRETRAEIGRTGDLATRTDVVQA